MKIQFEIPIKSQTMNLQFEIQIKIQRLSKLEIQPVRLFESSCYCYWLLDLGEIWKSRRYQGLHGHNYCQGRESRFLYLANRLSVYLVLLFILTLVLLLFQFPYHLNNRCLKKLLTMCFCLFACAAGFGRDGMSIVGD